MPISDPHGEPNADAEADSEGEKVPKAVLDLYEARRGYANYYVNRQYQQKFMELLKQQSPFTDASNKGWLIEGKTQAAEPQNVVLKVDNGAFELRVGDKTIEAKTQAELYGGIEARNATGALACLDAWRRMLRDGTERFGDCYYRGQAPLLGQRPLRHWMIGSYGELEASWLYHPDTNQLEAIEVYAIVKMIPLNCCCSGAHQRSSTPSAYRFDMHRRNLKHRSGTLDRVDE